MALISGSLVWWSYWKQSDTIMYLVLFFSWLKNWKKQYNWSWINIKFWLNIYLQTSTWWDCEQMFCFLWRGSSSACFVFKWIAASTSGLTYSFLLFVAIEQTKLVLWHRIDSWSWRIHPNFCFPFQDQRQINALYIRLCTTP